MPPSSPERHLVAPDNSNIASRQASQDSDREVKYQTGLMPAEYAGLEVASPSPGMKYYQPAPGAAPEPVPAPVPGGYAPYQDQDQHNGSGYESHQYPAHSTAGMGYGGSQAGIPPKKNKRIWGIPVATFWVAIVALVFFLGTIGASAAAGTIAQAHAAYVQTCQAKLEQSSSPSACASSGSSAASASPSASGASALSASASATASSASSTSTSLAYIPLPGQASSILGEATTNCPDLSSENKTYTVPNSNLRFVRECGNNYPMNDLGHIPLTRMEDCMNLCAALAVTTQSADGPCVGVAWVTAGKQGTDENYCWLKSAKGAPDPKANIEAAWLVRT
ncbi:hypothetical protein CABS01_08155 [Colletotrichum abscissum]|uniref:Apple domain-containing protein n=1 Tax=Colletotrichum abscissum TaxID=1671311 RepID=A0A9P9X602_9PEZI|nr:uncharacterized protein CABS01_08155 [Colletotrichum abscissum]KAI3538340.1 hypothetical protein CABS02_11796 [Colletotrichum abscissum]KAK1508925.1 hypothetical protein CABS01_08155 [Colletotrichum abscissum]